MKISEILSVDLELFLIAIKLDLSLIQEIQDWS
jgi:hypothetical protein